MIHNYYLYYHIRLDKNEVFYVGIGIKPKSYSQYIREYSRAYYTKNRNYLWNNIVNKTDYKVEIIFETTDINEIKLKEIQEIKKFGKIINGGILSNITDGGEGSFGMKHSKETIEKFKVRLIGNKIRLNSKHSEETKKEMSKKRYENPHNARTIGKYLDNQLLEIYKSIEEANRSVNCKSDAIGNCCRGLSKKSYGYNWKYI